MAARKYQSPPQWYYRAPEPEWPSLPPFYGPTCDLTALGSYSKEDGDDHETFALNDKQIRVLSIPMALLTQPLELQDFSFDLTQGYQTMAEGGWKPCTVTGKNDGLGAILKFICKEEEKQPITADFVSKRGVFARILYAPYNNKEDWCFAATKFRDTIYMNSINTEERLEADKARTENLNKFSYSGLRFEKYVSKLAHPTEEPEDEDLQIHGEYHVVIASSLGPYKLVYNAEMDCVATAEQATNPQPQHFIEIKTTRNGSMHPIQMNRWWAQSHVTGCPSILLGHRDDDMTVRKIQMVKTDELPTMTTKWTTDTCLKFMKRFLDFVKETVLEDDPDVMYLFSWKPGQNDVSVVRKSARPGFCVVPKWYSDQF